jgi:hypothetical protein
MGRHVSRTRVWGLALVGGVLFLSAAVAEGCTVPALDLADKKCASAQDCTAGQTCSSAGACVSPLDSGTDAALLPSDLCHLLPRFTGSQTVDGQDDDFSSVPAAAYPWGTLPTSGGGVAMGDHLDVTARVGWSALGLHMFMHVHYETGDVRVPKSSDPLWYGDAIELFLKGNSNLTGPFGKGVDVGALQIVAAPDLTSPPRTQTFVSDGDAMPGPLPAGTIAARRDDAGYAIEFMIPWSLILPSTGASPVAGSKIAFDFAVDYRSRSAEAGMNEPQYQLLLALRSVGTTTCREGIPLPPCDDRTWCTPTLSP